jgi:transposase-like protein
VGLKRHLAPTHEDFEHDVKLDVEARVHQGVKTALEEVLEEEMSEYLQAGGRELTPTRRDERNGSRVTVQVAQSGREATDAPPGYFRILMTMRTSQTRQFADEGQKCDATGVTRPFDGFSPSRVYSKTAGHRREPDSHISCSLA